MVLKMGNSLLVPILFNDDKRFNTLFPTDTPSLKYATNFATIRKCKILLVSEMGLKRWYDF